MSCYARTMEEPVTSDTIAEALRRIRPSLTSTPLVHAHELGADLGQPLWLKAESLQRTGSFKVRGALNWVLTADEAELANGLVTVSAGNHALALAWAAAQRGVPVTVVMPEGSSPMKVEGTRALGGTVILHGRVQDAVAHCHELSAERQMTLVHPYGDWRVIAGQGTVGLELLEQLPETVRILCPVGGGGLISGLGLAIRSTRPDIELIGIEPEGAATMHNAWQKQDAAAALETVDTIAPSLAPAMVAPNTYHTSRKVVDRIVTVSDEAIIEATRRLLSRGHLYVEPGAAVGIAALLQGAVETDPERPTVAIITGGNMDLEQLAGFLR